MSVIDRSIDRSNGIESKEVKGNRHCNAALAMRSRMGYGSGYRASRTDAIKPKAGWITWASTGSIDRFGTIFDPIFFPSFHCTCVLHSRGGVKGDNIDGCGQQTEAKLVLGRVTVAMQLLVYAADFFVQQHRVRPRTVGLRSFAESNNKLTPKGDSNLQDSLEEQRRIETIVLSKLRKAFHINVSV